MSGNPLFFYAPCIETDQQTEKWVAKPEMSDIFLQGPSQKKIEMDFLDSP